MLPTNDISTHFWLFCAFAFIIGSCIGSFLNVVTWRLPRGQSLIYPPSQCPHCGHRIRAWENIPILSWLALRARCSGCHQPISIRYPLGEAATGLLFTSVWLAVYFRNLPFALLPGYFLLTGALLSGAWLDIVHRFIPDEVNFFGMASALILAIALPSSRLALQATSAPAQNRIFLDAALRLLRACGVPFLSPMLTALLDCLLGILVGILLLAVFAWCFQRLLGERHPLPQIKLRLTANGAENPSDKPTATICLWKDLLEEDEEVTIHGKLLDGWKDAPAGTAQLLATRQGLTVDGEFRSWKALPNGILVQVERCSMPRDVMGGGDIKMLGMIGGFLGADAVIFILLFAALFGFLCAGGLFAFRLAHKNTKQLPKVSTWLTALPFGPFLALSAYLWMLFGNLFFQLTEGLQRLANPSVW
ncbi:MAG: prepilin peptidase [Victivallales bacterium]|nr:prepilin peptidase [Victivallales bacterium]